MNFSETLREIRKKLGFDKARGFHAELAESGVECNYAYYMKMEAGQVIPSAKIVEQISLFLSEELARELLLSYCRTLFPRYPHFFPSHESVSPKTKERETVKSPASLSEVPGRELTRRQIAVLGRSKVHYHIFLLATIARRPLQFSEIRDLFPNLKPLQEIIQDLVSANIIRSTKEGVNTYANEHAFPTEKEFPELKPTYRQFDEWDEVFAEDMNFQSHLNKMLIRRISPRYLGVIEDSLDMVIKFIRAADEMDTKYNDSLVQVRLSLKSGKLPG